jgi:hypothetical protein
VLPPARPSHVPLHHSKLVAAGVVIVAAAVVSRNYSPSAPDEVHAFLVTNTILGVVGLALALAGVTHWWIARGRGQPK